MGTEKKARHLNGQAGSEWSGESKLSDQTWGYSRNQMVEWDLHGVGEGKGSNGVQLGLGLNVARSQPGAC